MADYRYLKIRIQVDFKTLPKVLPDPGSWSRADPGTAPAFSQLLRKWTQLSNEKICTGTVTFVKTKNPQEKLNSVADPNQNNTDPDPAPRLY